METNQQELETQLLAELFKVLGDPTRLRIVRHLLQKEMCVTEIADAMDMGQSAISHQLRVLRQARLVTFRKEGKTAWYRLNDDHVIVFSVSKTRCDYMRVVERARLLLNHSVLAV